MKSTFQVSSAFVILSALLAGCSSQPDQASSAGIDMISDDLSYTAGFSDGCYSGEAADQGQFDNFIMKTDEYRSNESYATGWADAYRLCEDTDSAETRQSRVTYQWMRMDRESQQRFASAGASLSSAAGVVDKEMTNTLDIFYDQDYLFDD